ncbi:uncharacterized protein LOC113854249 [Abrus precatorius]|uniref:Uncharacterized protein LOC113854249 n=1 Tax=Abrus precatorius TaxID=3816 RepID=A0A8B8KCN7_ABRPR|nr:uncharacterized protein LOC113854249 [Abrus precatorius]
MESIMEVREDCMLSPVGDSEPTLRIAHFLKPISNSIDGSVSETLSSSVTVPPVFEPKEWPLVIHFNGWRHPKTKWFEWVDTLQVKYESVWKKVGIFEAIMCSTKCHIVKNQNLAIGVAEKWCSKTNSFLFPWGEATITLEDMMVLGGYPIVGEPVFTPLQSQEMREVEKKLVLARREPWRSRKGKATTTAWMDIFFNSGSEIEHEAFLATWLSMFVFSHNGLINKFVFPIAIHLARGNSIALAPAVLACIYKDLSLLKKTIVGLTKPHVVDDKLQLEVTLQSPFYLVQIWVWERFKNLQPQPKLINHEDPILFRWHEVKALKIHNVRFELDSAMEDFLWRPYVKYAGKCRMFYPEHETCVPFGTDLDKEIVSFVTCLRVSELVGMESITKQYLPHRVAMQFGMDQDVPGSVPRFNGSRAIAWANYCRPISDRDLYFPSRLFEADVTTRYAKWWKQSVLAHQDFAKNIVRRKRSARSSNHRPRVSKANKSGNDADVPPGFPPKLVRRTVFFGKPCDDVSDARKGENDADVLAGLETVPSGNSVQDGLIANENIDAYVPTSFSPKDDTLTPCISVENFKPVLDESKCGGMTHCLVKVKTDQCKNLSNQSSSASTADYGDVERILPLTKAVVKDVIEPTIEGLEEDFEDANGSKESKLFGTQSESGYGIKLKELEERISRLETMVTKLKRARFGHS